MQWRWNSSLFHQHTSQRVPIETEFCPWPFNHVLVIQPASDNHTPLRGRLHGYGYEAQPLDERTQCLVQWLVELLWVVIKPLNNLCPSETLTSILHDWTLLPLLPFCVCFFLLFFLFRLILFQCKDPKIHREYLLVLIFREICFMALLHFKLVSLT